MSYINKMELPSDILLNEIPKYLSPATLLSFYNVSKKCHSACVNFLKLSQNSPDIIIEDICDNNLHNMFKWITETKWWYPKRPMRPKNTMCVSDKQWNENYGRWRIHESKFIKYRTLRSVYFKCHNRGWGFYKLVKESRVIIEFRRIKEYLTLLEYYRQSDFSEELIKLSGNALLSQIIKYDDLVAFVSLPGFMYVSKDEVLNNGAAEIFRYITNTSSVNEAYDYLITKEGSITFSKHLQHKHCKFGSMLLSILSRIGTSEQKLLLDTLYDTAFKNRNVWLCRWINSNRSRTFVE